MLCTLLLLAVSGVLSDGENETSMARVVAGPIEADFDSPACARELGAFCANVEPGRNRRFGCLLARRAGHARDGLFKPASADPSSELLGEDCREAVQRYQVDLATFPLSMNAAMRISCASDALRLCADAGNTSAPESDDAELRVKTCLAARKRELTPDCHDAVLAVQIDAASSIRLDPLTHKACADDLRKTCVHVRSGQGKLRACLHRHRASLAPSCVEALFASAVRRGSDLRLHPALLAACRGDIPTQCPHLPLSDPRLANCLALHKRELGMSSECSREVERFQAQRASSFKLDPSIAAWCKGDIARSCSPPDTFFDFGFLELSTALGSQDGRVLQCLKLKELQLQSEQCRREVHRLVRTTIDSFGLSAPLRAACDADARLLCGREAQAEDEDEDDDDDERQGEPSGAKGAEAAPVPMRARGPARAAALGSQTLLCLHRARTNVSNPCRAELFKRDVIRTHDIDFNPQLRERCATEIATLCASAPHGGGVVACLERLVADRAGQVGERCKGAVVAFAAVASQDFRLNPAMRSECGPDISRLCSKLTAFGPGQGHVTYSGRVIHCLRSRRSSVRSSGCREAVDLSARLAATDIRTDSRAVLACRADIRQHCARVLPGEGRVYECLGAHRLALRTSCQALLAEHERMAAHSVAYDGAVRAQCSAEASLFCDSVSPHDGALLSCLQSHLTKLAFGPACRTLMAERIARGLQRISLDFRLHEACGKDVRAHCADLGPAAVRELGEEALACAVDRRARMSEGCRAQLGQSLRNALYLYGANETRHLASVARVCDSDRERLCALSRGSRALGSCLARSRGQLSDRRCAAIVQLAEVGDEPEPEGGRGALAAASLQAGLGALSPLTTQAILAALEANRALAAAGAWGVLALALVAACVAGLWCLRGAEQRRKGYTAFVTKDG